MSGFTFDAKAALARARASRERPTVPTFPTQGEAAEQKVGTVGNVGWARATQPQSPRADPLPESEPSSGCGRDDCLHPFHAPDQAAPGPDQPVPPRDGMARSPKATGADRDAAEALTTVRRSGRVTAVREADAATFLALLRREGPMSYGAAATENGWGATRAWRADDALAKARLIKRDNLGRAVPVDILR